MNQSSSSAVPADFPAALGKSDTTPTNRREVLRMGLAVSAAALLARASNASAAETPATAGDNPLDAKLLPGFKAHNVKTSGATLHTVIGGSGPPLLLIHGAPLTHLSWFKVAPELAKKY